MNKAKTRMNALNVLAVMARPLPELPNTPSYTLGADIEKVGVAQVLLIARIALIWQLKKFCRQNRII